MLLVGRLLLLDDLGQPVIVATYPDQPVAVLALEKIGRVATKGRPLAQRISEDHGASWLAVATDELLLTQAADTLDRFSRVDIDARRGRDGAGIIECHVAPLSARDVSCGAARPPLPPTVSPP